MKKITVSVPEEVYRKARVKAAELGSSVSSLVREYLIRLVDDDSDFDRRKRLQDEVLQSVRSFRASERASRGELHERHAVR